MSDFAFAELARAEPASNRQRAYASCQRERGRGLSLLRIFEPGLADRFLREVLFPETRRV